MPMGRIDSAESFAESDVTVSTSGTVLNSGTYTLKDSVTQTATNPVGLETSRNQGLYAGLRIELKEEATLTQVLLQNNISMSITDIEIWETLDGNNVLWSKSGSFSNGDTVSVNKTLQKGIYTLAATNNNSNWNYSYGTGQDTGNSLIDSLGDGEVDMQGSPGVFHEMTAEVSPTTSGTVTVEWSHPQYIYDWDRATFQHVANGGSIDVYVEASSDGGSTWTEVAGPISRGDAIPAAGDDEVRLRVDFSRPSSSDTSPSLEALYRRYAV
jgi:hypothetical protein